MSSDSDIIVRSLESPAAFGELYDRHARAIHRFALRRVDARATAEDVMSETFLVAFERRAGYDTVREDARPWLFGIATILLKRHARLEARAWKGLVAAGAAELGLDDIERASARVDAASAVRRLATAIRRMPARDRDALLLYAWADLDYEGVAEALDVPVGTVRSRLNRARRTLRAAANPGDARDEEVEHGGTAAVAQGAE